MLEIIDLDVFVPQKKVITFTIIKGHETKRMLEEYRLKLASAKNGMAIVAYKVIVAILSKRFKKYTHRFDITNMSFGATAFILAHLPEFNALSLANASNVKEADYKLILGIVADIAMKSDSRLTVDYLFENLYLEQNVQLMQLAVGTITAFMQSNPQDGAAAAGEAGK